MNLKDEPCIQAVNMVYCYLRLGGMDEAQASRQLQAFLPELLNAASGVNIARLIEHAAVPLAMPGPCAPPDLARGHVEYPALTD